MVPDPRREKPIDVIALRPVASRAHAKHFRALPRRPVKLRALIAQPVTGWQRDASVHELSLGGASITLPGRVEPGDQIVVSFFAPSLWDPLALPARVVWVRAAEKGGVVTAGLAFEPKDPAAMFALFELVSAVAS
jgi:hypothetical protein